MDEKPPSEGIQPIKREGLPGAPRPQGLSRLRKKREVKQLRGGIVRYGCADGLGQRSALSQGAHGGIQQTDVPLGKFQAGVGGELACSRPHGIDCAGVEKR